MDMIAVATGSYRQVYVQVGLGKPERGVEHKLTSSINFQIINSEGFQLEPEIPGWYTLIDGKIEDTLPFILRAGARR